MKKLLFIAMLIIACAQGYAQSITVTNNIPGSALQFKVRGQNSGAACNTSLSLMIPLPFTASWLFPTPTTAPLAWGGPLLLPFTYDAVYFEVLSGGGMVLCTGTVGKPACGWPLAMAIPCLPGHTATWSNVGPNVTVVFN